MSTVKLMEGVLFIAAMLSGFYAGTGFFVAIGGNPAIRLMSNRTFAEYWQHTDHYMAARMKIFGPMLLGVLLLAVGILVKEYHKLPFWLMLTGLGILLADIVFTVSTNHPLNRRVQAWNLDNLPSDVQDIKGKIVSAFNRRIFFMISSFIMVLLSVWMHNAAI